MSITIDESGSVVTVINLGTVEPDHQEEFAHLWIDCLPLFRERPGFVSAAVHKSADRQKVVTYLQWKTLADHQSCLEEFDWSPEPARRFAEFLGSGKAWVDPQVYEVLAVSEA